MNFKYTIVIFSACIFTVLNSFGTYAGNNIDSLKLLLAGHLNDTVRVNMMFDLAEQLAASDSIEANSLVEQAIILAKKTNYKMGVLEGISRKASINNKLNHYEETLYWYDSAAFMANSYGFPKLASESFYSAGLVCYMHSRYAEALNYFFKDLKIIERLNDSTKMATLYNDIGVVYENLTDYENSLIYHGKSLEMRKQLNDKKGIAMSENNLGMVIFYKKEYLKSLWYHQESLRMRRELNDAHGAIYSMFNISNIFFAVSSLSADSAIAVFPFATGLSPSRISEVLLDSASSLRQSALAGATKLNDHYAIVYCMKGIGEILVTKKKWNESLVYLEQAASEADSLGMQKELYEIYLKLYEVYAGMGNIKDALKYHKLYAATKDSVFNMQSSRRIASLQTQIIVDKKEQQIEILNVKSELQVREIKRQKLIRNMTIAGILAFMIFSIIIFRQRNRISKEKKRSEELLLNILPFETAEELKLTGAVIAKTFDKVTVMFTDFKNFTAVSERLNAEDLVKTINYCYSEFDKIITIYGIEKIKTIGDSYMCAGGLPVPNQTHAEDTVRAAIAIRDFMHKEKQQSELDGTTFFDIRIGIHTGDVVAGVVGIKKFAYDIWGDTVNIASRMESSGEPGKINISAATYERIKNKFTCNHRGKIQAKNKGEIDMYFVE